MDTERMSPTTHPPQSETIPICFFPSDRGCRFLTFLYFRPPLLDPALDERLRDIRWATILMCYDYPSRKVVLRHIIPRQYPLRLENKDKAMIQGKSMNQVSKPSPLVPPTKPFT